MIKNYFTLGAELSQLVKTDYTDNIIMHNPDFNGNISWTPDSGASKGGSYISHYTNYEGNSHEKYIFSLEFPINLNESEKLVLTIDSKLSPGFSGVLIATNKTVLGRVSNEMMTNFKIINKVFNDKSFSLNSTNNSLIYLEIITPKLSLETANLLLGLPEGTPLIYTISFAINSDTTANFLNTDTTYLPSLNINSIQLFLLHNISLYLKKENFSINSSLLSDPIKTALNENTWVELNNDRFDVLEMNQFKPLSTTIGDLVSCQFQFDPSTNGKIYFAIAKSNLLDPSEDPNDSSYLPPQIRISSIPNLSTYFAFLLPINKLSSIINSYLDVLNFYEIGTENKIIEFFNYFQYDFKHFNLETAYNNIHKRELFASQQLKKYVSSLYLCQLRSEFYNGQFFFPALETLEIANPTYRYLNDISKLLQLGQFLGSNSIEVADIPGSSDSVQQFGFNSYLINSLEFYDSNTIHKKVDDPVDSILDQTIKLRKPYIDFVKTYRSQPNIWFSFFEIGDTMSGGFFYLEDKEVPTNRLGNSFYVLTNFIDFMNSINHSIELDQLAFLMNDSPNNSIGIPNNVVYDKAFADTLDARSPSNLMGDNLVFYYKCLYWNYFTAKMLFGNMKRKVKEKLGESPNNLPLPNTTLFRSNYGGSAYKNYLSGYELYSMAKYGGLNLFWYHDQRQLNAADHWLGSSSYHTAYTGELLHSTVKIFKKYNPSESSSFGAYLVNERIDFKQLVLASKGATHFEFYRYGPYVFNPTGSDEQGCRGFAITKLLSQMRIANNLLAIAEDNIHEAKSNFQPKVAMIFPQTEYIWRKPYKIDQVNSLLNSYSTGEYNTMSDHKIHKIFSHLEIPIDLIYEDEIEYSNLEDYAIIYINSTNLKTLAYIKIKEWVIAGGNLIVGNKAILKDEFNQEIYERKQWLNLESTLRNIYDIDNNNLTINFSFNSTDYTNFQFKQDTNVFLDEYTLNESYWHPKELDTPTSDLIVKTDLLNTNYDVPTPIARDQFNAFQILTRGSGKVCFFTFDIGRTYLPQQIITNASSSTPKYSKYNIDNYFPFLYNNQVLNFFDDLIQNSFGLDKNNLQDITVQVLDLNVINPKIETQKVLKEKKGGIYLFNYTNRDFTNTSETASLSQLGEYPRNKTSIRVFLNNIPFNFLFVQSTSKTHESGTPVIYPVQMNELGAIYIDFDLDDYDILTFSEPKRIDIIPENDGARFPELNIHNGGWVIGQPEIDGPGWWIGPDGERHPIPQWFDDSLF